MAQTSSLCPLSVWTAMLSFQANVACAISQLSLSDGTDARQHSMTGTDFSWWCFSWTGDGYGLLHGCRRQEVAFWEAWNPWGCPGPGWDQTAGLGKRWHIACTVLQTCVELQTSCSSPPVLSRWFQRDSYFAQWYCSKWAITAWKSLINQHLQIQNLFPVFAKFIATHLFE